MTVLTCGELDADMYEVSADDDCGWPWISWETFDGRGNCSYPQAGLAGVPSQRDGSEQPGTVTSAGVVYRRPLGDLVVRLCGEFGGQGGLVVF